MTALLRSLLVALVALLSLPAFAGPKGTLILDNMRSDSVQLILDRGSLGAIAGQTERSFRLPAGAHEATLLASDGRVVHSARFTLSAGAVYRVSLAPPTGKIEVENRAGTTLRLAVDGATHTLHSGDRRSFTVKTGAHRVVATYEQLGRDRLLEERTVVVAPEGRERVLLNPATSGLVRVDNRTGRDALLRVDGRDVGLMRNNESREVPTRLGRVSFTMESGGRLLSQTSLAVGLYDDVIWTATAPRTGELVVQSPLPIPVRLVDSKGHSAMINAYGRVTLSELDAGSFGFRIERTDGVEISHASVTIRPLETTRWTVPVPQVGVVQIINEERFTARILVDARAQGAVSPGQVERLALPIGTHSIELLDQHGRVVSRSRITIDRYQDAIMVLGARVSDSRHGHHDDSRHDDHHERPAVSQR